MSTPNRSSPTRRTVRRWLLLGAVVAAAFSGAGCAHAPPATGDRAPGAFDPDNPEMNCSLNNTVDCRPASD